MEIKIYKKVDNNVQCEYVSVNIKVNNVSI